MEEKTSRNHIIAGDALTELRNLPDCSVDMCLTSPPYFGLRNYGIDGQIGLEANVSEYIYKLIEIFAEVKRVLADTGTLWLNISDSYAGSGKNANNKKPCAKMRKELQHLGDNLPQPNAMPESVRDRNISNEREITCKRNRRDVWSIATKGYSDIHFATFPERLAELCILAGCPIGGTVLDPFFGAGTVGVVAKRHGYNYVGIELNPEYCELSRRRIAAIKQKDG